MGSGVKIAAAVYNDASEATRPGEHCHGPGRSRRLLPTKLILRSIRDQQIWQVTDSTGRFPDIKDELLPTKMISDTSLTINETRQPAANSAGPALARVLHNIHYAQLDYRDQVKMSGSG